MNQAAPTPPAWFREREQRRLHIRPDEDHELTWGDIVRGVAAWWDAKDTARAYIDIMNASVVYSRSGRPKPKSMFPLWKIDDRPIRVPVDPRDFATLRRWMRETVGRWCGERGVYPKPIDGLSWPSGSALMAWYTQNRDTVSAKALSLEPNEQSGSNKGPYRGIGMDDVGVVGAWVSSSAASLKSPVDRHLSVAAAMMSAANKTMSSDDIAAEVRRSVNPDAWIALMPSKRRTDQAEWINTLRGFSGARAIMAIERLHVALDFCIWRRGCLKLTK